MRAVQRLGLASSLSLALLSAATSVSAQPADVKQRAEAVYKEGLELAKLGKNDAALQKFQASYAVIPSGVSAYQMARMEERLGRSAIALDHYREALQDPALPLESRRDTERAIDELKKQIGIISLDVPAGATVIVDSKEVDAKAPVEVVPGPHKVIVRLGGDSRETDVSCPPGKVTVVKLRFEGPPDNGHGTPPPFTPPPAETPHSGWSTPHIVTTAGLGVAAIGAGVLGFVFRAQASDAVDEARTVLSPVGGACVGSSSPECQRAAELQDERDDKTTLSTISFIGAGVFAAGALATAFLWPENKATTSGGPSTRRGIPHVSPAGLGAQVHILF